MSYKKDTSCAEDNARADPTLFKFNHVVVFARIIFVYVVFFDFVRIVISPFVLSFRLSLFGLCLSRGEFFKPFDVFFHFNASLSNFPFTNSEANFTSVTLPNTDCNDLLLCLRIKRILFQQNLVHMYFIQTKPSIPVFLLQSFTFI
jgi:hypothetical protein